MSIHTNHKSNKDQYAQIELFRPIVIHNIELFKLLINGKKHILQSTSF